MDSMRPLLTEEQIQERVAELAAQITQDYVGRKLLLIGVLKGCFVFLADLARKIDGDLSIDFVQVSSYGTSRQSSGIVQILLDTGINIEGRNVIIVEDIEDSGLTLKHLRELLSVRKPKSLRVCALLSKMKARGQESQLDYVGFEIPDEFVVGYGLDYAERYRSLPYIAVIAND